MRRERGAAAVEFALVAPLLFMLVFGVIGFGLGFMQLQTIRGAVREGARTGAVCPGGTCVATVQQKVSDTSAGLVPAAQVLVTSCDGAGVDSTASFNTGLLNGGQGIVISIPLLPDFHIATNIAATFRCER